MGADHPAPRSGAGACASPPGSGPGSPRVAASGGSLWLPRGRRAASGKRRGSRGELSQSGSQPRCSLCVHSARAASAWPPLWHRALLAVPGWLPDSPLRCLLPLYQGPRRGRGLGWLPHTAGTRALHLAAQSSYPEFPQPGEVLTFWSPLQHIAAQVSGELGSRDIQCEGLSTDPLFRAPELTPKGLRMAKRVGRGK